MLWKGDMIKWSAIEKIQKICKWHGYNQMYWDEKRCSGKDQKLLKLFPLKSPKQARKVNKETGEETEEIKCLKKKGEKSEINKNNKSKWDDLKCRERHQSLPNWSSLKWQDFIPFPERNWNIYTHIYDIMLPSAFWWMLLESKLYFQYCLTIQELCITCIVFVGHFSYLGKVCVYISITTLWMFSYQYQGVSFHIAQRYMYPWYFHRCHLMPQSVQWQACFWRILLPASHSCCSLSFHFTNSTFRATLIRIILVFWTRTITPPPWQGCAVRGVLMRSTSHHIHTREFISEVLIPYCTVPPGNLKPLTFKLSHDLCDKYNNTELE